MKKQNREIVYRPRFDGVSWVAWVSCGDQGDPPWARVLVFTQITQEEAVEWYERRSR